MIKAIVFDFDGVILESANLKTGAFRRLFEEEHRDKIEAIVEYHCRNMGISRFVKFRHIYEHILRKPYSAELEKQLGLRFEELIQDEILRSPFVPGSVEFLKKKRDALPMFVASGTPDGELREIAKKMGVSEYFKELHGSPKEKKDILRDILKRFGWKPEEVAFVGDAESDLLASKTAGVHFIGRTGNGNLSREECRYSIDDLRQLETTLAKI